MSCHSCHTDGHTSGRLADTLGDDTFGTPKRVLSLLGLGASLMLLAFLYQRFVFRDD